MAVEPNDSSVMKRAVVLALKVIALTIILSVCDRRHRSQR